MPDKATFDETLADIRRLLAQKDFVSSQDRLARLSAEDDQHLMGEVTALGLPRRLHSAYLRLAKAKGDAVAKAGYQYLLVPPPEVFAPYGRFSPDERRAIAQKNREAVPRLIHQIWIGNAYRLWREADLEAEGIDADPIFRRMLEDGDYPGAVDVARYFILLRVGGIYLDCDFYPARDDLSFGDILPMVGLTAFAEETPRLTGQGSVLLANSFIATPPGHPVFERILQALPEIAERLPRAPAWWGTGPLIFSVVARAGSVTLAGADFVAALLADRADFSAVEEARAEARAKGDGLLIAWKSW